MRYSFVNRLLCLSIIQDLLLPYFAQFVFARLMNCCCFADEKGFVNRQQLTLASSVTSRDLISLSPVREDAGKLSLSPDADKLATLKTSPSQLDAKGRQTLAKQSSSEWRALLDDMAAEEISTTTTAYRAMYTFEARSGDEVSVRVGDVVTVLQFGDAEGNSEWWRVRTHAGNVGYLPANFLQAV